jgi:hypothetical protein
MVQLVSTLSLLSTAVVLASASPNRLESSAGIRIPITKRTAYTTDAEGVADISALTSLITKPT